MTIRKYFYSVALVIIGALISSLSATDSSIGTLPPNTTFAIQLSGFRDLPAAWDRNPLSTTFSREGLIKYYETVLSEEGYDQIIADNPLFTQNFDLWTEISKDQDPEDLEKIVEILQSFRGNALFYGSNFARSIQSEDPADLSFALLIDMSPDATWWETLVLDEFKDDSTDTNANSFKGDFYIGEYSGVSFVRGSVGSSTSGPQDIDQVDFHLDEATAAVVDNRLLITTDREIFEETVDVILGTSDKRLADTKPYQFAFNGSENDDLLIFLNIQEILPILIDRVAKWAMEEGAAMAGFTASSLVELMGGDAYQAVTWRASLIDSGISSGVGLNFSELRGIMNLLGDPSTKPRITDSDFIPSSAVTAQVSSYDFGYFFRTLDKIAREASPNGMQIVDMQLQNLSTRVGFSIRNDILENFGAGYYSAMFDDSGTSALGVNSIYALNIRDSVIFESAIWTLIDQLPDIRSALITEKVGDTTMYSLNFNPQGVGYAVSFAFAADKLLFSKGNSPHGLRQALRNLNGTNSPLVNSDRIQHFSRLIGFKGEARALSYFDISGFIKSSSEQLFAMVQKPVTSEQTKFIEQARNINLPYLWYSESALDKTSFQIEAVIVHKDFINE